MAVYDQEKEKTTQPSRTGSHDDLGVHPERREAEVADLEKQFHDSPDGPAGAGGAASASSEELAKMRENNGEAGDWDTNVDDSEPGRGNKRKVRFRRIVIGGGITGVVAGGAFGIFTLAAGPMQFIHISQMLQKFHFGNNESFMESRNRNLYTYMRNYRNDTNHRNRLGVTGNKLADRYEKRLLENGIKINYESGTFGRVQSFSITDPNTPAAKNFLREAEKAGINISNLDNIELPRDRGSGRKIRALYRSTIDTSDMGVVSSAVSKRLLIKRGGVSFHNLTSKVREGGQSVANFFKGEKEARAERIAKGNDAEIRVVRPGEGDTDLDPNSRQAADEADDIFRQTQDINPADPEAPSRLAAFKRSLLVKGGTVAVAVVGVMCTVQNLGDEAENVQYEKVLLPMMRSGIEFVSIGSQVATALVARDSSLADVSWEELGAMSSLLYITEDEDPDLPDAERSFFSAQSIQAEQGKAQTGPDLPEGLKPANLEQKPTWLAALDAIPGLRQVCGIQTAVGNLPVIKQIGDASSAVISFATAGAIDKLVDLAINVLAGDVEIANASGALLGNVTNYGTLLAANDNAISMGGTALTQAEVFALDTQTRQERMDDARNKSVATRYLSLTDSDSLAAKTLFESSELQSPQGAITSIARSPLKIFQDAGSSLVAAITPSATAQSAIYSYGIPEYGFSASDINDPRFEDPFENADIVEPELDRLNEEYGECFGTTVRLTGAGSMIETKETVKYSQTSKCNNNNDVMLTRYRFYLADTIAMKVQECFNLNESCDQLGFGGSANPATTGQAAGATIQGNVFESSEEINCAPGTNDLGVHDGYNDGQIVRVRLCAIPNLSSSSSESNPGNAYYIEGANGHAVVNSRVSGAVLAMIEAASADGVQLNATSAFRSNAHQSSLFRGNPNPALVARPGYSNHQMGIAIDFTGTNVSNSSATTCANRQTDPGNPIWVWLKDNALRFGFRQYSAESWHWDASTGASRCE